MSRVEAVTNVGVGSHRNQLAVFAMFAVEALLRGHPASGIAFVGVSLARSYLVRRLFEGSRRC